MTTAIRKTIYLDNAFLVRQEIRRYTALTDEFVVASGMTVTVTIATDADGLFPIAGLSGLALTEVSANPGVYVLPITTAQLAGLDPYAGQTVYQITTDATGAFRAVVPLLVRDPRYI